MRKSSLILSLASALTLGAAGMVTVAAEAPASRPAPGSDRPPIEPVAPSVLSEAAQQPLAPIILSDHPFESLSGGIALCYPVDCKAQRELGKDDLMDFRDESRKSSLVISRRTYPSPMNLTLAPDGRGKMQPGILEQTAAAIIKEYSDPELLKKGLPGLKMLRQDLTNLGNYDVGMLVFRYTREGERRFAQRAIIEANDQVFYAVSFTTLGRKDIEIRLNKDGDEATEDPGERQAVESFRKILDSVKLLDRKEIHDDQVARLFRTRTLLHNWTERKLASVIIPEQYTRIVHEEKPGLYKDVGWRYIVEEPDRKGVQDGILVGIHRVFCDAGVVKPSPKTPRWEKEEWLSVTMDRKHEDWSRQSVLNDGSEPTPGHPWPKLVEFGTSDLKTSRFLLVDPHFNPQDPKSKLEDHFKQGTNEDPHQPWVGTRDNYSLNVQYVGTMGNQDPVNRPLPVFYLPQALDTMLPRLIPPNEVKTYLLATYVGDTREVMLRYVEVLPSQQVTLAGRSFQAIPITDHIGLQGSVTTHYVTPAGQYLGSENKDTKLTELPTDRETVIKLWPDANPHRPGDLGSAPVAAAPQIQVRPGAPARRRGGITVGPDAPFDANGPLPDGRAPYRGLPGRINGDSIVPDPILPDGPARNRSPSDPRS